MRFFHALLGHNRIPVLGGINFEIKPHEWVFLCGESGSGKSTILQTLGGLLKPLAGSLIDNGGRDVYKLSPKKFRLYRRSCGMIFQDFKLIASKTVEENIAYALEICRYSHRTIHERTGELLMEVDMYNKRNAYPPGLSSGECQRVAIARALIHEPSLILADEPMGSLDQKNTLAIMKLLKKIHATGTTIVFATHDRNLLSLVPGSRSIDIDTLHSISSS